MDYLDMLAEICEGHKNDELQHKASVLLEKADKHYRKIAGSTIRSRQIIALALAVAEMMEEVTCWNAIGPNATVTYDTENDANKRIEEEWKDVKEDYELQYGSNEARDKFEEEYYTEKVTMTRFKKETLPEYEEEL